jgi:hypothetical protein
MINQSALYKLCISFINSVPNLSPEVPMHLALQSANILDINLPRGCGKSRVATKIVMEYEGTAIIIPPNRNRLRQGYPDLKRRSSLVSHTDIIGTNVLGSKVSPLEGKIIIIDDCTSISPEEILHEYLAYPHQNRDWMNLRWQAPKIISLGTRYKL